MKLTNEQQKIVEENMPLVGYTINKYLKTRLTCMSYDDLTSIGYVGLCKAAVMYKPELGKKFSTYAVRIIVRNIQRELLLYTRQKRGAGCETISYDKWFWENNASGKSVTLGYEPDFSDKLIDKIAFEPVWKLCPTHKEMFDSRLTCKQIAKEKGISVQTLFSRRNNEFKTARLFLHGIGIDKAV